MLQIRCPACDTLHALEAAPFARGPRKVRCAKCRLVWEAAGPDPVSPPDDTAAAHPDREPADDLADDLLDAPFPSAPAGAPGAAEEATGSSSPDPLPDVQLPRRRPPKGRPGRKPPPGGSTSPRLALLATTGFVTLASLLLFRHDVARVMPDTAPVFERLGLEINLYGLDITDVGSRIVQDENGETLDIIGRIVNITRKTQKIPLLRLSIRSRGGQELYVWTAAAERSELAPGESLDFRRRLASPPGEAHSVMVRFVARNDIIAALHQNGTRPDQGE